MLLVLLETRLYVAQAGLKFTAFLPQLVGVFHVTMAHQAQLQCTFYIYISIVIFLSTGDQECEGKELVFFT